MQSLAALFDAHIHLREGELMEKVVPLIKSGGTKAVYVMPNLNAPICHVKDAIAYRQALEKIDNTIEYYMSLYLSKNITEQDIIEAKANKVYGVKWYPKGVTTKSENGISDIKECYHVLKWMENCDLILNIHGEVPFDSNVTVLNAEERFIPTLFQIRKDFPNLKIVVEHVTTKALVDAVEFLDDRVVATITLHHLVLTVNDWAGCSHNFCKPVAKTFEDMEALWSVIKKKSPKFFLGSDSAPHLRDHKNAFKANAGIFTSPILVHYLAHAFEEQGILELLEDFSSTFGKRFYGINKEYGTIQLEKKDLQIQSNFIVPYFKEGETISYCLK